MKTKVRYLDEHASARYLDSNGLRVRCGWSSASTYYVIVAVRRGSYHVARWIKDVASLTEVDTHNVTLDKRIKCNTLRDAKRLCKQMNLAYKDGYSACNAGRELMLKTYLPADMLDNVRYTLMDNIRAGMLAAREKARRGDGK